MEHMVLTDNFPEDWPEILDIFGSVWMDGLGRPRPADDWTLCLNLMEHLFLDLCSHMDFLLEHPAVCFNILGPLGADDPYMWLLLHTWDGLWLVSFVSLFFFLFSLFWTLLAQRHFDHEVFFSKQKECMNGCSLRNYYGKYLFLNKTLCWFTFVLCHTLLE